MTEPQIFELGRGQALSTAAVGKTIVHPPTRDAGTPLFLGLLFGLPALGLGAAAVAMIAGGPMLIGMSIVAALLAAVLGWLAGPLLADAVAAWRFNRCGYEVRFGQRDVEVRGPDGVERVELAEAPEHPFLRSLALDARIHTLVRVRAACMDLPDDDDVRVVLETLAMFTYDDESELSEPPRCYAIVAGGAAMIVGSVPDDDVPGAIYEVVVEWDEGANVWMPRLTPAGVRRVRRRIDSPAPG